MLVVCLALTLDLAALGHDSLTILTLRTHPSAILLSASEP